MTQKNDGGQAHPAAWGNPEQGGDYIPGMTLRDWFAGQALAGIMAAAPQGRRADIVHGNCSVSPEAKTAYSVADAMLAARDKD